MCNYGILLSQIEDTIDSNNFREYAFGFPDMNSVSLFDESFIRTIAIKKMLHFLSTISLNNKNSSSFEKEYSSRVKILIIKLEKKLLLELNSDDLKDHESNMFEDHLSVEFENKYRTLNSKNSEDDITIKNLDEVVNNPTDNISNDIKLTKEINEELKEDLTVLAEEMKNSALRFGELMKREKEVGLFFSISLITPAFLST